MIPNDLHPAPGAGTGRTEPRRTTYKRGDRIVELIRCAQCGFFFRDGIDVEGDSIESPGISEQVYVTQVNIAASKLPQPLKGMTKFIQSSVNYTGPTITTGCRLCGSLNPRGKNRNWRDYGTGVDLSNK